MSRESGIIIKLRPGRIVQVLSLSASLVLLASVVGQAFKYSLDHEKFTTLIDVFYIDCEGNIPTFFTSLILLVASMLLGLIYGYKCKCRDWFRFHWLILGAVFLFMAVDESTLVYHELLSGLLKQLSGNMRSVFWIGIITVFMLLCLYQFSRFFLHFSNHYRTLLVVSAAIYISGAVFMDIIATQYHEVHGIYNFIYSMLATLEKMLEIGGVIVFIHTLLSYLSDMNMVDLERDRLPVSVYKSLNNKNICAEKNR